MKTQAQEERRVVASSSDGTIVLGIPLVSSADIEVSGVASIGLPGMKMEEDEDLDVMGKGGDDDEVDVGHMLSVVNAGGSEWLYLIDVFTVYQDFCSGNFIYLCHIYNRNSSVLYKIMS